MPLRRAFILLLILVLSLGVQVPASGKAADPEEGLWIYLSDIPWARAYTGWVAVGDEGLPTRDTSFTGEEIRLAGTTYAKGLGVYPVAEIEYDLHRAYARFESDVGISDEVNNTLGSIEFRLYGDEVELYKSGPLRVGQMARVDISVVAVDKLRLVVTDGTGGVEGDHALWAGARLFQPAIMPSAEVMSRQFLALRKVREADEVLRSANRRSLVELRRQELASSYSRNKTMISPATSALSVEGSFDPRSGILRLSNGLVSVSLGFGGEKNGYLAVLDLANAEVVIYNTTAALWTSALSGVSLHSGSAPVGPDAFSFEDVIETGLGRGKRLEAKFQVSQSVDVVAVRLTLFQNQSYFTYQIGLANGDDGQILFPGFRYFEPTEDSHFYLGEGSLEYITDNSRIRQGLILGDGVIREDYVGTGQPVFVRNTSEKQGLVMAAIDDYTGPMLLTAVREKGSLDVSIGLNAYNVGETFRAGEILWSPRLFVEIVADNDNRTALASYRRVMGALYPPMPLPQWVKYQWLSWYVYKTDIDDEKLRKQIDYIAANLADLGPWHIVVDAGWYVAEGREGADWRNVDSEKFPSGLRALVDYAHSKGVRVVLYFSAPFLNDQEREGNWLGLKGIIEQHPEWLRLYSERPEGNGYLYDFTNAGFQSYLGEVMNDFFDKYDVDGIKIDGLGNGQGTEISTIGDRSLYLNNANLGTQTALIYRQLHDLATSAKNEVYIESGWTTPAMANRYANTFRYGDENPSFSSAYPFGGLEQHIDYAIMQKTLLGQRPNIGAVWGNPRSNSVNRSWLAAGLALGTQVVLGFDLATMNASALSQYRSFLVHYNAFLGETVFGDPMYANSFATTTNGITYMGAVNRNRTTRNDVYGLSNYGLDPEKTYIVFNAQTLSSTLASGAFAAAIPASSFRLFLLRSDPGVLWTNSSFATNRQYGRMKITADGPKIIEGSMQLFAPNVQRVLIDGRELKQVTKSSFGYDQYQYDRRTGLVRLRYRHDKQHTIEVEFDGERLSELAEAQLGIRF